MTLVRRAFACLLACALALALAPLPASARMLFDATGTNVMNIQRVTSGPRLVALAAATAGNLLASPTDLSVSPPWYNPVGAPTTLSGTRLVVGPGDNRQTVVYQTISVTAGHTYIADANFAKVPGSGAGVPRVTFYKVGDPASTYAGAIVEQIGNYFHTFSTYTATATGDLRVNIEMPTAADNGCDITFLNLLAFDTTAGGTAALPALRATTAAIVTAPAVPDAVLTEQYLTAPNWPTAAAPAVTGAQPQGMAMASGATNVSAVDFRVGTGNLTTRAALDAAYYYHSMFGDVNSVTGLPNDGIEKSYGRYRRFPAGHKFDLHTFSTAGLTLGVVSKGNTGTAGPGNWYAGALRDQTNIVPGMTVEVIYKPGTHDLTWNPVWLEQGYQASPGRVSASRGNPYYAGLIAFMQWTANGGTGPYYEWDGPDMYSKSFVGTGYEMGKVFTAQIVRRSTDDDPVGMVVPPYTDFVANGAGITADGVSFYPRLTDGTTFNAGMHAWVMNWLPDGTMEFFYDGKLYLRQHQEYKADTFVDAIDGQTKRRGMHLVVGGQAIPNYGAGLTDSNGQPLLQPATVADRSTLAMTVQSIKVWNGNLDRNTIAVPANGVTSGFQTLMLMTPNGASPFTSPLVGKSLGSKVVATSASGQTLTVSGDDANGWTLTGSGTSSAVLPITLTEYPYATDGAPLGLAKVSVINAYSVPTAYLPTEIAGNLIASNGYGDQGGNSDTEGWAHAASSIATGQADRAGSSKGVRWQTSSSSGSLEYFKPGHALARERVCLIANNASSTFTHYAGAGDEQITLTPSDGWKCYTWTLPAGAQWNLYNSQGNAIDVTLSDAAILLQ